MCCVVDCQVHPSAPRVKVCLFVVVALSVSTAADLKRVKVTFILAGSTRLPVGETSSWCSRFFFLFVSAALKLKLFFLQLQI